MGLHHHHRHEGGPAGGASPAAAPSSGDFARRNVRVARLSVITAATLALAKLAAVFVTGSLAIAASLTDSVMDIVASSVNFFAVRLAGQPADDEHRYGHGKAEGIAGLGQGLLIGFVGLVLLGEGIRRLASGAGELAHTAVGIGVMTVSLLASGWISWMLLHTAKQTGSVALKADAAHYTSDVWMNLGVLAALVGVRVTGWNWIDGAVSCFVALIVMHASFTVLRQSMRELMDVSLSDDAHQRIREAIAAQVPEARDVHALRSRKSGPNVFIDLHVSFDRETSFPDAHRLSAQVARAIEDAVPGAEVHVHADPHPFLDSDDSC
jgi:ferrous-iron efflux pump FieF